MRNVAIMRFVDSFKQPQRLRLRDVLSKKEELERYFKDKLIDLVFVHGSLAKDVMRALSDVDIAVLFREDNVSYKDVAEIVEKLSEMFGRDDIDVAVMNHASPLLCMQVLTNGRLLYGRSGEVLKTFRLRTLQRYLASKHLMKTLHRYMQRAIARSST